MESGSGSSKWSTPASSTRSWFLPSPVGSTAHRTPSPCESGLGRENNRPPWNLPFFTKPPCDPAATRVLGPGRTRRFRSLPRRPVPMNCSSIWSKDPLPHSFTYALPILENATENGRKGIEPRAQRNARRDSGKPAPRRHSAAGPQNDLRWPAPGCRQTATGTRELSWSLRQ